jgi:hypothetical protein
MDAVTRRLNYGMHISSEETKEYIAIEHLNINKSDKVLQHTNPK